MTEKDILGLLKTGERGTLECKKADNNVPNSLWETYSAFANTNGGVILLGVFEDTDEKELAKRFKVTGVKDADKLCKDFWNTLNSSEKVNVNLLKDEDVQIVRVQGKDVIAVNVPRADCSLRPIYINNNMLRGSFRRGHAGDYRCPELIEEPELMQVKLVLYINGIKDGIKDVTIEQIDTQSVTDDKNGKNGTKSGTKDGTKSGTKTLTKRKREIINRIKVNSTITIVELAQKTGIPRRTLIRELSDLQDMGVLSREGNHRKGVWVVK